MRYFIDTEFYEGVRSIDLISIALVAEDGREYYAECSEYDWQAAYSNRWLRDMVLANLTQTHVATRQTIAREIREFVGAGSGMPVFWGWCSAYDYVALSQLYGGMMRLPYRWPHHIADLQLLLDERGLSDEDLPEQTEHRHSALADARYIKQIWQWLMQGERPKGRATTLLRKTEVILRLLAIWEKCPDLRLGQLILNSIKIDKLYNVEDYPLIEMIERLCKESTWDDSLTEENALLTLTQKLVQAVQGEGQ